MNIAIKGRAWIDPSTRPLYEGELPDYPTMAAVSHKYRLNYRQHVYFDERAYRLLLYYCNMDDNLDLPQQISSHAGVAGTGKSTAAAAVRDFAIKWKHPNSIGIYAFTHAASNNIRGVTLSSALHLGIGPPLYPPSPALHRKLIQLRLILIDELGQLAMQLAGLASVQLQNITEKSAPMGGVDYSMAVDWLQVHLIIQLLITLDGPTLQ